MRKFNIKERKEICDRCPIFKRSNDTCNSDLWINPDTDEISPRAKAGYIKGCGCIMSVKMNNPNSHCVAGKW